MFSTKDNSDTSSNSYKMTAILCCDVLCLSCSILLRKSKQQRFAVPTGKVCWCLMRRTESLCSHFAARWTIDGLPLSSFTMI